MKIVSVTDLEHYLGQETGLSDWFVIDQAMINAFADITHDHQFIHIDPQKAKDTPFGGTIAHGFLTLSMGTKFAQQACLEIKGAVMGVNYGFDKLRFISPVPSESRVRGRFTLASIDQKAPDQILLGYDMVVEIEGRNKPALIARWLGLQILK